MRTGLRTVAALIAMAAATLVAEEEPTRVLMLGGYLTAQDNMPEMVAALLQHGGFGDNVQVGFISSDAHASPTSNKEAGLIEWVRGKGVGEGRRKKLADAGEDTSAIPGVSGGETGAGCC